MKINNKYIGHPSPCYIIAEISHNHQGKESEVMKIVTAASVNGASAIKFQKRDNINLFLPQFYNKTYSGENSFGKTYGEHREYLEPKISWLKKANKLAHKMGLDFIMTVFDEASLLLCEKELRVDAYKIQSADLTSHFLISKIALTKKPYFISCGASSLNEIKETYKLCKNLKTPFCLMYAVSEYPTKASNINLSRISQLKKNLKTDVIGFSCHYEGIEPAIFSRMLGVTAIEKHFTLNKMQKGPDHKLSITPPELKELRKVLDYTDVILGKKWSKKSAVENYQLDARYKMGKCAVAAKNLLEGAILKDKDISYKSPMEGINPLKMKKLVGKILTTNLKKGQIILTQNLK